LQGEPEASAGQEVIAEQPVEQPVEQPAEQPAGGEMGAIVPVEEEENIYEEIDKKIKDFSLELACAINYSLQKLYGAQNATEPMYPEVAGGM